MKNEEKISWYGRLVRDADGMRWFHHTASGFAFRFCGTRAKALIKADNYASDRDRPYLAVLTDGQHSDRAIRIPLTEREQWIVLAQGLEHGVHEIRVLKCSEQTANADASSRFALEEIVTDGEMEEPPAHGDRRMEFYGDSITCGYGVEARQDDTEFTTSTENGLRAYAFLAAESLHAECNCISASGWPLWNSGWNDARMYTKWDKADFAGDVPWDFTQFIPDVVVINLGTNDNGYLAEHPDKLDDYLQAYASMVRKLAAYYPKASIVAAWGMMAPADTPANGSEWLSVLEKLRAEGICVYPLRLSGVVDFAPDSRLGHPGVRAHRRAARELAAFVSALTGWEGREGFLDEPAQDEKKPQ